MPTCLKCNTSFRVRYTTDDGVTHNLQRRKYCLECSPFKRHNTKNLHSVEHLRKRKYFYNGEISTLVCTVCAKPYRYQRHKGITKIKCGSCRTKEQRLKRKKFLVERFGGKCSICGYDKCIRALQFHHRNPTEKKFAISLNYNCKLDVLISEAEKCILVCANCHVEIENDS